MRREGDVITFEPEDGDLLVAFERGVSSQDGAESFASAFLKAFHQASMERVIAWREFQGIATAAGLLKPGEGLTYHWEKEEFTVQRDKADPAGNRLLVETAAALDQAKLAAVEGGDYVRATALRDVTDLLRKVIRAPAMPDGATTSSNAESAKDAENGSAEGAVS